MVDDPSPFLSPGADVLHLSETLLVVAKPAGILSHPNARGKADTAAFLGSSDERARVFRKAGQELFLVHRLDREASGILIAARSEEVRQAMVALFEAGAVKKRYHALLCRTPARQEGRWSDHLVAARQSKSAVARVLPGRAPNSLANYRVLRKISGAGYALVEIDLVTGRTHQIRIQAAHRRLAVLGDRSYGDFDANREARRQLGLKRLFLHATKMVFRHPVTSRKITLECPLPEELAQVLVAKAPSRKKK